jgi:hypothetical protein
LEEGSEDAGDTSESRANESAWEVLRKKRGRESLPVDDGHETRCDTTDDGRDTVTDTSEGSSDLITSEKSGRSGQPTRKVDEEGEKERKLTAEQTDPIIDSSGAGSESW